MHPNIANLHIMMNKSGNERVLKQTKFLAPGLACIMVLGYELGPEFNMLTVKLLHLPQTEL